jgi:thioredoxin-like negative regulator of GroEL
VSRLARLFGRRGPAPPGLRLLTRPGCHLCEEMKAKVAPLVARLGGTLAEVDVDADPALSERFGLEIPVLLDAEGRVVAKLRDPVERIAKRLGA